MPYKRTCLECRGGFTARQYSADFCGAECRRTFNNRRATRGAVLYDLLLIQHEDHAAFDKLRLDGRLTAMVEGWRKEDAERGRKRTTKRPSDVQADTLIYANR